MLKSKESCYEQLTMGQHSSNMQSVSTAFYFKYVSDPFTKKAGLCFLFFLWRGQA